MMSTIILVYGGSPQNFALIHLIVIALLTVQIIERGNYTSLDDPIPVTYGSIQVQCEDSLTQIQ